MGSPFISRQARASRDTITKVMARYGPVDLDPSDGTVTRIAEALEPLNRLDEFAARLDRP